MTFDRPPEPYAPLEPVSTCDPTPKPGVEAFRDWVIANWGGRSGGIARDCSIGNPSKHHEGRAWDWFPPDDQTANELVSELLADDGAEPEVLARRAGLRTIIWSREIWIAGAGWAPYLRSPHTDHIHFGFGWDGAHGRTSFYQREEGGGALRVAPFCAGLDSGSGGRVVDPEPMTGHNRDAPSEPGHAEDIYAKIDEQE
jgi:hypothetical protein